MMEERRFLQNPEEVGMAERVKKDKNWIAALLLSILVGGLSLIHI